MMIMGKELGLHMKDHSAPLVELLQKHISLNLSRAKCLGLFIISMLNSRTVNMSLLCNRMPSGIKAASWYRRMQRFISEISISWRVLPVMLVMMTGLEQEQKWVLCLDRTKGNTLHDIEISEINLCILLYHEAALIPDGILLHNNDMFTVLLLSIEMINNPKHFALDKLSEICFCNNSTRGAE